MKNYLNRAIHWVARFLGRESAGLLTAIHGDAITTYDRVTSKAAVEVGRIEHAVEQGAIRLSQATVQQVRGAIRGLEQLVEARLLPYDEHAQADGMLKGLKKLIG